MRKYLLLALAVLGVAGLFYPPTAVVLGPALLALGINIWVGVRSIYRRIPAVVAWLDAASEVLGWILVGLTLILVVAFACGWLEVAAVVCIVLGSISLCLYFALDWVNTILNAVFRALAGFLHLVFGVTIDAHIRHVHATSPASAKLSAQQKIDRMGALTRFFWMWSLILFFGSFVLLWLPTFTAESTFLEVVLILLGSVIILVGGALGLLAVVRVIVGFTSVGTVIVAVTMLFGFADLVWTQMRFANMNAKSLAATEHRIEQLQQLEVHWGGLNPGHRAQLNNLLALKARQQAAADKAAARRQAVLPSFNWFSDMDPFKQIVLFLATVAAIAICVSMFKGSRSAAPEPH